MKIKIEGKELKPVSSVRLIQGLFSHDQLEVTFPLKAVESKNKLIKQPDRFLGKTIQFESDESKGNSYIWNGLLTKVNSVSDHFTGPHVKLIANDPTIFLENGSNYRSFEEDSDFDSIISNVLRSYPKNSTLLEREGKCEKHKFVYAVQYGESDYEFLLRLCNQVGEWIFWTGKKLRIGTQPSDPVELLLDRDVRDIQSSLRIRPLGFDLVSRDYLKDGILSVNSSDLAGQKPGEFESLAFNKSQSILYSKPHKMPKVLVADKEYLQQLAKIRKTSEIKGLVLISGITEDKRATIGKKIVLKVPESSQAKSKSSTKYGEYIIVRSDQEVSDKNLYQNYFEAIPAEVPLPPLNYNRSRVISTVETATVVKNNDPDKIGRVKVRFVWQKKDQSTPWIRVSSLQAGQDRGIFFTPEIDDEVLVCYENGNPEKPIVIGGVHHANAKTEHWKDDKNLKKGFRTKSGNEIIFWDEAGKERIEIQSKGTDPDFKISLSLEENGKISIKANKIEIEGSDEVKIKSKKVEINGTDEAKIKAKVIKLN